MLVLAYLRLQAHDDAHCKEAQCFAKLISSWVLEAQMPVGCSALRGATSAWVPGSTLDLRDTMHCALCSWTSMGSMLIATVRLMLGNAKLG